MDSPDWEVHARTLRWLAQAGYSHCLRRDAWFECLLTAPGESWLGRGASASEALEDALRQAFPSQGARRALQLAVAALPDAPVARGPAQATETANGAPAGAARRGAATRDARDAATSDATGDAAGDPTGDAAGVAASDATAAVTEMGAAPAVAAVAKNAAAADAHAAADVADVADVDSADATRTTSAHAPAAGSTLSPVASGSTAASLPARQPLAPAPVVVRRHLSLEEGLEEGQELLTEIHALAKEVAVWNAERQRLVILVWIAAARDVQEAAGRREVKEVVRNIAHTLNKLSGRWWPGSVFALQENAYPASCTQDFGLATPPGTWDEVAKAASERLEALSAEQEADGADEDGWWDRAELDPAHPDPESLLREAVHKLEDATGPLDDKPDPARSCTLPADECQRLGKNLRWIRGAVSDSVGFGDALGRLRWVAWRRHDLELQRVLDPRTRPARSWADELGFDPEKRARRERRHAVVRALAALTASVEPAQLSDCLRDALDCPELEVPRLASLVQPYASAVLELPATSAFSSERKLRTRLGKLQRCLRDPPDDLPPRAFSLAQELGAAPAGGGAAGAAGAADAAGAAGAAGAADAAPEVVPVAGVDPAAQLLAEILPLTRGRRVLLVSNRADTNLCATLTAQLELASLDLELSQPRRIDALVERIAGGRYDLVLSATGFQGHSASERIEGAARRAGVPCSRVYRARLLACVRALHRDRPAAARGASSHAP